MERGSLAIRFTQEPPIRRIAQERPRSFTAGKGGGRCVESQSHRRSALVLPQHPDKHRSKCPILLAVDQQLGEGAGLRVAAELADPLGPQGVSLSTRTMRTGVSDSQ